MVYKYQYICCMTVHPRLLSFTYLFSQLFWLSHCPTISVWPSVYISFQLSVFLFFCLCLSLSVNLFHIALSIFPSILLFLLLPPSVGLSVCQFRYSVCLTLSVSVFFLPLAPPLLLSQSIKHSLLLYPCLIL